MQHLNTVALLLFFSGKDLSASPVTADLGKNNGSPNNLTAEQLIWSSRSYRTEFLQRLQNGPFAELVLPAAVSRVKTELLISRSAEFSAVTCFIQLVNPI